MLEESLQIFVAVPVDHGWWPESPGGGSQRTARPAAILPVTSKMIPKRKEKKRKEKRNGSRSLLAWSGGGLYIPALLSPRPSRETG